MSISPSELYPIMGLQYDECDFARINLSSDLMLEKNIISTQDQIRYHESIRKRHSAKWLIGGYLERRSLYKSQLFEEDHEVRDIHLGIDIWGPAGSKIAAPLDGFIHSYAYNEAKLDYGFTVILRHSYKDKSFYLLYGHLSQKYFSSWYKGKKINQGQVFGTFGSQAENGGWLPHLHLQMIFDMEDKLGDYPGVCSESKLAHYQNNCPDPSMVIKM